MFHRNLSFHKGEQRRFTTSQRFKTLYTGGLFHCYMLDESICHFGGSRVYFVAFILFSMEIPVSKQWSRSALFAYDPFTGFQVKMGWRQVHLQVCSVVMFQSRITCVVFCLLPCMTKPFQN